MDKAEFCHLIALETTKMLANSNSSKNQHGNADAKNFAKDLAEGYIQACFVASDVFDVHKNHLQVQRLI